MSTDRSIDLARVVFQLLLIGALIAGSAWILWPFVPALVWGATLVVATWPLLLRLQALFGGRRPLAVVAMTLVLLLVLILPLYAGISTLVEHLDEIAARSKEVVEFAGSPPPAWVESLPVVGTSVASHWRDLSSAGPSALAERLAPYIRTLTGWLLAKVGGIGATMLQFLLAIAIAAVFYANGETTASGLSRFARRVGGEQTENALTLAGQAVQAVALGVGVTALIQSLLAGVGLAVAGIPFAGPLTAVVFVLCIAQIGPILVLLPAIVWLYWQGHSGWGTGLLLWSIPVGLLDNFLRPVLIKQGADLSLLLILPGVIGGLLAFGVIGLFIGPVLLAVGYTLLVAWVEDGEAIR